MKKSFDLTKEYITLGQFLKEVGEIDSGGAAKFFLQEHAVYVDDELENRRGRKLYAGMKIELPNTGTFFMKKEDESSLS